MCWPLLVAAAVQAGMSQVQQRNGAIATNEATRKNSIEQLRSMNINDANLRLKENALADSAGDEKSQANLTRISAMGALRAAVGEGLVQGKSMDRIQRVSEGEYIRANARVDENYRRDYASLFGERVSNIEETKRQIDYANNNEMEVKSPLEIALDPMGIGIAKPMMKTMNKIPGGNKVNEGYNRVLSLNKAKD